MAKFSFNGLDTLEASFQQLAQLSDEEKYSVIAPAAELLKDRFVDKICSLFTQRTGDLARSITVTQRVSDNGAYAHIAPAGKHSHVSMGKRKRKKYGTSRKYYGTNAEVAYILEYGSPRISASHWMETTNEESEDEIVKAEAAAWDNLLKSKGL